MGRGLRTLIALVGVAVVGAAVGATAWAVIGGDGVVDSCFSQAKGTWRPVEHGVACKSGEERLAMYTKDAVDQKLAALGGSGLVTARWNLTARQQSAPVTVGDWQAVATCPDTPGLVGLFVDYSRGGVHIDGDFLTQTSSHSTRIYPFAPIGNPGGDTGPSLLVTTEAEFLTIDPNTGHPFPDGLHCYAVSVLQQAP